MELWSNESENEQYTCKTYHGNRTARERTEEEQLPEREISGNEDESVTVPHCRSDGRTGRWMTSYKRNVSWRTD